MATSKNPFPELMERGRERKMSLLETTLLIFSVSHLTASGRERWGEGEGREHHLALDRCDISCTCQVPLDTVVLKIKLGEPQILLHSCKVQMRHVPGCSPLRHTNEHMHNQHALPACPTSCLPACLPARRRATLTMAGGVRASS